MKRISGFCFAFSLLAAGCSPDAVPPPPMNLEAQIGSDPFAAPNAVPVPDPFAYSHSLQMEMEAESVEPRFERTRDYCLEDVELGCVLLSAQLRSYGNEYGEFRQGSIRITLPHDQVARFEELLVAPLLKENPGDAVIVSRSTSAENVEREAADIETRVEQLTTYRDKLTELSERNNLAVDDLIRLAHELSDTQRQLDLALSRQNVVADRVMRETLAVSLNTRRGYGSAAGPLARVWGDSVQRLARSTANAIGFLIAAVPWLPIFGAGFYLFSWMLRFVRRRLSAKPIPAPAGVAEN